MALASPVVPMHSGLPYGTNCGQCRTIPANSLNAHGFMQIFKYIHVEIFRKYKYLNIKLEV